MPALLTKMDLKSKKGKQSPLVKKPTLPRPLPAGPDLPPQLLNFIRRNYTLRNNISFGGNVTKSYVNTVSPKRCNPMAKSPFRELKIPRQLMFSGTSIDRCYAYTLVHIVGYSHGLVFGRGKGYVPLWDINTCLPSEHVGLSSSPIHGNTPILNRKESSGFPVLPTKMRCICSDQARLHLADPHSTNNQPMKFTHAIGFKGKFYALSLQGTLAVIEEIDSHLQITGLSKSRAVPSVTPKHFKEYLVESNGEILLVFLICRKSTHSVDDAEVYQLRPDILSWVKMERIGDRTLFVGVNCCLSVNASEVGCIRNSIYFSHETVEGWWVYDMERRSISPGWNSTDCGTKSPVWDEPNKERRKRW